MLSVECEVWSVREVWSVKCEVWSERCGIGCSKCGVRSVEFVVMCDVWSGHTSHPT